MKIRNNRPRPKKFLALSILSVTALALLINSFPPDFKIQIFTSHLSPLTSHLLFPLLFLFLFSTTTFITKNIKHGMLLGLFVICYLGLRLVNLTHPFFFLLLAGLFLMLELLFSYKR
jgi:hypothetical protein